MEKKLAEYRAKKNREDIIRKSKEGLKNMVTLYQKITTNTSDFKTEELAEPSAENEKLLLDEARMDVLSEASDVDDKINCCSYSDVVYYSLWFILWATVYMIFVKLQFGMVYLVSSALIGIYFNTRTKPKKPNEISAYSVFNKNCVSIDGTLTAEQFERELRYGR